MHALEVSTYFWNDKTLNDKYLIIEVYNYMMCGDAFVITFGYDMGG